jgi:hypothetical protein
MMICYVMLPVSDLEMLGFELPVSRVAELRSVRLSESESPSLPLTPLVDAQRYLLGLS